MNPLIINDLPYGTERAYNVLRFALRRPEDGVQLRVFLMADAVSRARTGQKVPEGSDSLERMLESSTTHGVPVGACGTCMDARGLRREDLLEGLHRSTIDEFAAWRLEADRVIVF